ncbi:MAG: DnaD domain protein [Peptostreptococcaceae bacterium]|nr:DnaD domain protein [Peptostreptococcaceae bacterium]
MAEKRMFSKTIIDSDAFLDMPLSSQALYFHLSMRADDDGFVNNPKKIQRIIGCGDDDLKLLMVKKFLIPFESGIVVIKHWRIHNYIAKDRYKETNYIEEKSLLGIEKNKSYSLISENENCTPLISLSKKCIQSVYKTDTQIRIDKNSIDKNSIDKNREEESTSSSCCSNFSNLDVFKHFEKCGFLINAVIMEQIATDIEIYTAKWVMDAATEAMNRGKINYKYVLGILQNWKSKGKDIKASNKGQEINPLKFNNFEAREYDYDDLEAKLLGWDK